MGDRAKQKVGKQVKQLHQKKDKQPNTEEKLELKMNCECLDRKKAGRGMVSLTDLIVSERQFPKSVWKRKLSALTRA